MARRIRDYAAEYQARQRKARAEGYRSYGAKRWAKERERDRAQRPVIETVSRPSRATREARAVEKLSQVAGDPLGARQRDRIWEHVAGMTEKELRLTLRASLKEIRALARMSADEYDEMEYPQDEPDYPSDREPGTNPFWYH